MLDLFSQRQNKPSSESNLEGESEVWQAVIFLERGLEGLERCGAVQLLGGVGQRRRDGVVEVRHRRVGGKSVGDNLRTRHH